MSARPGEWGLLGADGDPLPGDPWEVLDEATSYRNTASDIRDQVSRLRKMASGDNALVGQYAPALEDASKDLADHLEQAQGRFDTVAEQLTRWQPVLADGVTRSGTLLTQAEEAHTRAAANAAPSTPVDTKDTAAVTADTARSTRLTTAQGDLNGVVRQFNELMDHVNAVAKDVADKIDDSSHDDLKDSWWDSHVRKWIHDHANLLKLIADVLTWVATIIIVAILVLGTGGLFLAVIATAVALVLHSVLAMNGDGSWLDVALDVVALATMGGGKLLTEGARGMLALKEGAVAFSDASSAARAAFSGAEGFLGKAGTFLSKSNVISRNLRGAYAGLSKFSTVINTEFKGGALIDRITMGDKEMAGLYRGITESIGRNGPGFLLSSARGMMNVARPVFIGGVAIDGTAKYMNPAFPLPHDLTSWEDWKDQRDWEPRKSGHGPLSEWAEEHMVSSGGYW